MSISLSLVNFQAAQAAIKKEISKIRGGKMVTVGIHEEAGKVEDGDLTMASLGATHEFGASVDHPGGTSYGYATRKAAEDGQVRFLGKGQGYMVLGETAPHKIEIPARPWLEPGVASATEEIIATVRDGIEAGQLPDDTLEAVGAVAVGAVKQYMTDLKTPPNAKSTIAKKGSNNPLIDKGHLRSSVTHKVTAEPITEGLK